VESGTAFDLYARLDEAGAEEHQELSDGHADATREDATTVAPIAVGYVASDEGGEIDEAGEGAVNFCGAGHGEQGCHHIKRQERSHTVVRETL